MGTDRKGRWDFLAIVADKLKNQPLLVFALAVLVLFAGLLSTLKLLDPAVGIAALIILGLFLATVMFLAVKADEGRAREREARKAAEQDKKKVERQLERITSVRDNVKRLLGGLVSNDSETCFVYSSAIFKEVYDHYGSLIDHDWSPEERRVTSILDVRGISRLQSLLDVAEKDRQRLHVRTADDFQSEPCGYACNLILVGSGSSNPITEQVLKHCHSPFQFTEDGQHIIEKPSTSFVSDQPTRHEAGRWPRGNEDKQHDFGLLVKLNQSEDGRVHLIAAGIGSIGTFGTCQYLEDNVKPLLDRFGTSSFVCVIRVAKASGHMSTLETYANLDQSTTLGERASF